MASPGGDGVFHGYDYSYDGLSRLTKVGYLENGSGGTDYDILGKAMQTEAGTTLFLNPLFSWFIFVPRSYEKSVIYWK